MKLVEINLDTEAALHYFGANFNTNRKDFLKSKAQNDRATNDEAWRQIATLFPTVSIKNNREEDDAHASKDAGAISMEVELAIRQDRQYYNDTYGLGELNWVQENDYAVERRLHNQASCSP